MQLMIQMSWTSGVPKKTRLIDNEDPCVSESEFLQRQFRRTIE